MIKITKNKSFIIFKNVQNKHDDYNKLILITDINIIIINSWYKCYNNETIIIITHPLSYKYISNYVFSNFDKLYAKTDNNILVELNINYNT